MLKFFINFKHPDIWSNLEENRLISFRDSNEKRIDGTRNSKKRLMICPFLLKYFNNFEHPDIWSNLEENWLVSETQIRNECREQETMRSVLWSVPFCWNISTVLSIDISCQNLKKTVSLVSETQIRNKYMEQETMRRVLWPVPFCCNISAILRIKISAWY